MCSSSAPLFPSAANGQAMYNLKHLFGEEQSGRQPPLAQHSSEILPTRRCERPFLPTGAVTWSDTGSCLRGAPLSLILCDPQSTHWAFLPLLFSSRVTSEVGMVGMRFPWELNNPLPIHAR